MVATGKSRMVEIHFVRGGAQEHVTGFADRDVLASGGKEFRRGKIPPKEPCWRHVGSAVFHPNGQEAVVGQLRMHGHRIGQDAQRPPVVVGRVVVPRPRRRVQCQRRIRKGCDLTQKVRRIWTHQTHPVRRHAGQHPRVVHRHHIHLKPVPLGLDAFITNAIAVRIGRTLAPAHPKGVGLAAEAIAIACRLVKTAALVYLPGTVAHPAGILNAHTRIDEVTDAIAVHIVDAVAVAIVACPKHIFRIHARLRQGMLRGGIVVAGRRLVAIGAAHSVQDDFVGPIRRRCHRVAVGDGDRPLPCSCECIEGGRVEGCGKFIVQKRRLFPTFRPRTVANSCKTSCVPKSAHPASGIKFHPPQTTQLPAGSVKVTIKSEGQPPEPNTLLKFTVTESSGPSASTIQVVSVYDCPPFKGTAIESVSAHCAWDWTATHQAPTPGP